MPATVKCGFCPATVPYEKEPEAGWVPYFWDEELELEVSRPTCPACQDRLSIEFTDGGEATRPGGNGPLTVIG